MDGKEVPRPPPPPPPLRLKKNTDKRIALPAPPPPPAFLPLRVKQLHKPNLTKKPSSPPAFEVKRLDNKKPTEEPRCPLSHPTHTHTISTRFGGKTRAACLSCGGNTSPSIKDLHDHFFCQTCNEEFHRGCHTFPRKLTHPYHLQHPLTLTFRNDETGIISDANIDESFCSTVLSKSNTSDPVEVSRFQSDTVFNKCTWCGGNILGNWFYRCLICNFCLDLSCSQKSPLLMVANPKSHHHSLVLYPRPLLTPCDACGLVNVLEPSYACFQCNYMVHQSCIDLPRVIKITRHRHRISHTPYFQPIPSLCRVCYKTVDIKYGQYLCSHNDCSYVAHSKCATHENVWDGDELEWVPEEPDETKDIFPFIKVGTDLIKHFSHEHILKLEKYDGVRDAEKQCQACILPINPRDFYNCIQCGFSLHEVCAGLLRKLDHALHVHPLVLETSPERFYDDSTGCSICSRKYTGFRYVCSKKDVCTKIHPTPTKDRKIPKGFQIDVRCALVQEYFTHESHKHPLFISTPHKDENKICCKVCKKICLQSYLQCTEGEFVMCYHCATIPNKVSYKYDKHPLSLCYGEEVQDGMYWCEVCEKEVNPTEWFYTCNECCITIHVECIFGSSVYMNRGVILLYQWVKELEVVRSGNSTRPLCDKCGHRCPGYIYYTVDRSVMVICSLKCLDKN